jgi:hypothetical protein
MWIDNIDHTPRLAHIDLSLSGGCSKMVRRLLLIGTGILLILSVTNSYAQEKERKAKSTNTFTGIIEKHGTWCRSKDGRMTVEGEYIHLTEYPKHIFYVKTQDLTKFGIKQKSDSNSLKGSKVSLTTKKMTSGLEVMTAQLRKETPFIVTKLKFAD